MNIFLGILLFISINVSFPEDCSNCSSIDHQNTLVHHQINWWAASVAEVANAKCARQKPYSVEEMNQWIDQNVKTGKKVSRNIFGFNMTDDEGMVNALNSLLTYAELFTLPNSQKKFTSSCMDVSCALSEVFGGKAGTQLVFMLKKYNFNGSHVAYANTAKWRSDELDEVLLALSAFPEKRFPLANEGQQKLVHADRGYKAIDDDNGQIVANDDINIFQHWNELNQQKRAYSIVHELVHVIATHYQVDESKEWLKIGRWVKKINQDMSVKWITQNPKTVVSEYGKEYPYEDFAESALAYRFSPAKLKNASPEAYELIKNIVFNGVDYLDGNACGQTDLIAEKVKIACEKTMSQIIQELENAYSKKGMEYRKNIADSSISDVYKIISDSETATLNQKFENNITNTVKSIVLNSNEFKSYLGNGISNLEMKVFQEKSQSCKINLSKDLLLKMERYSLVPLNLGFKNLLLACAKNKNNKPYQEYCNAWSFECGLSVFGSNDPIITMYGAERLKSAITNYSKKICDSIQNKKSRIKKYLNPDFSESEILIAIRKNPL